MDAIIVANWMLSELDKHSCLYQVDVVDYLVRTKKESLLRENSIGNLVLDRQLLDEFKRITKNNVVWVKAECCWRLRVEEDELGRVARG